MLKHTIDTLITDLRLRPDSIAFCDETGANLIRSRKQYILVINQSGVRHWPRSKVQSDEDAIAKAQKSLDKIVAGQQAGEKSFIPYQSQEESDSASLAGILRNMEDWSEPANERVDFSEDCP